MIKAFSPIEHRRQQRAVQPDGREKVQIQGALPLAIVKHGKAACGRGRPADHVNDNINATETIADRIDHRRTPVWCRDIGGDEIWMRHTRGCCPRCHEDFGTRFTQSRHDSMADTLRAASHQCAEVLQLAIRHRHHRISSDEILSPSRRNTWSSVTGLPGKSPATLPATIVAPSRWITLSGSTVC
jgi:hypothetical protein